MLTVVMVIFATTLLAHAATVPTAPGGLCSSHGFAVTVINFLLGLIGQRPIC